MTAGVRRNGSQLVTVTFPLAPILAARAVITLLPVRRTLLPIMLIQPLAVPTLALLRRAVVLAALIATARMTLVAAPVMASVMAPFGATVVVEMTLLRCR